MKQKVIQIVKAAIDKASCDLAMADSTFGKKEREELEKCLAWVESRKESNCLLYIDPIKNCKELDQLIKGSKNKLEETMVDKDNTIVVRINRQLVRNDIIDLEDLMRENGSTEVSIRTTISELISNSILTTELFIDTKVGGIVKRIAS